MHATLNRFSLDRTNKIKKKVAIKSKVMLDARGWPWRCLYYWISGWRASTLGQRRAISSLLPKWVSSFNWPFLFSLTYVASRSSPRALLTESFMCSLWALIFHEIFYTTISSESSYALGNDFIGNSYPFFKIVTLYQAHDQIIPVLWNYRAWITTLL